MCIVAETGDSTAETDTQPPLPASLQAMIDKAHELDQMLQKFAREGAASVSTRPVRTSAPAELVRQQTTRAVPAEQLSKSPGPADVNACRNTVSKGLDARTDY